MSTDRPPEYLVSLVRELCKLPQETEWAEFKVDDAQPQAIGEYLSALGRHRLGTKALDGQVTRHGIVKPLTLQYVAH